MAAKICKDCKWCIEAEGLDSGGLWECRAPQNQEKLDLVTGKIEARYSYCTTLRDMSDQCGPDGKWWEAK